ncbi:MAG: hypothetical protein R3348_05155 [Xanthomonadales bacterium]|nr:hypothetical protein [Xanthomonadales bacterium]
MVFYAALLLLTLTVALAVIWVFRSFEQWRRPGNPVTFLSRGPDVKTRNRSARHPRSHRRDGHAPANARRVSAIRKPWGW